MQHVADDTTEPKYHRLGDGRFTPGVGAQGAWRDDEQHMAPISGLLAQCIAEHDGRAPDSPPVRIARISYEILGFIPLLETTVQVRTIRPGRTIELVEATAAAGGRAVVRATAWRLATGDTTQVAGGAPDPMGAPASFPVTGYTDLWGGGYIRSLEMRRSIDSVPGLGRAWLRTPEPLVDGCPSGEVDPTAAYVALVDTANGIVTRASPREWMFPNVDLTVHLFRVPDPAWVGLSTRVVFGGDGIGLTSSDLFDVHGAVGRAEQILTVRPMPGAGHSPG